MIELLELNLHNYKAHRRLNLTFEAGVVGIVGGNYTGKSSIISAICFLFTGEVDTDRKVDCVSLGETDGWVIGKIRLNGKEGILTRQLHNSGVELTYDGVTYKKVSEVNQLWQDLLQIDSSIFNNVIVAKQNEIQSLFSNETAVREKIFQKIFMVPPTEKLRSDIWNGYIKKCPPEKAEEDVQQLQSFQSQAALKRNELLKQCDIKIAELGAEELIKAITDRVSFLEKCQTDLEKKPELEFQLIQCNRSLANTLNKINDIKVYLARERSLVALKKEKDVKLGIKPVFERKTSILTEIDKLEKSVDYTAIQAKTEEVKATDASKDSMSTTLSELNGRVRQVIAEKNHLLSLRGQVKCPTCRQSIPDREVYLQQLMDEEVELNKKVTQVNASHAALSKHSQSLWSALSKNNTIVQRIDYLNEELAKIKDVQFSNEEFHELVNLIALVEQRQKDLQQENMTYAEMIGQVNVLQEKINNLAIYNGKATIEQELEAFNFALSSYKQTKEELMRLQVEAGKLEHELALLMSRIAISQTNHDYNVRRKAYLDKLEALHDLFNVTKFPRKLIETYMSNVQASLSTYLQYFGMPFTIKVEEGFKIRLYNENGLRFPTVSGGQEIMIGICLRLALHQMFAQAFPIWIIDEGSNNLSEVNRQNYFNLINELRQQKIIQQIIVVDHDERLTAVVDQVIQL